MVALTRLFHAINKILLHNICSILKISCNSLFLVDMFYFLGSVCRATLKTEKIRYFKN